MKASHSNIQPIFPIANRSVLLSTRIFFLDSGTICVTASFPFIFNKCLVWDKNRSTEWWSEWLMLAWFVPFIMVFQFGWAAVQISHLALIPELSKVDSSRTTMNSLRYVSLLFKKLLASLNEIFMQSADEVAL